MKTGMWITIAATTLAIVALFVAGLGGLNAAPPKPPAPTNGTVAFAASGVSDTEFRTALTVKKPNPAPPAAPIYKELVNKKLADCGPNEVPGGHKFPGTATPAGIGAYYEGLLIQAGYVKDTDFTIAGGVINLFGVTKIDFGSSVSKIKVGGTSDSKHVPATRIHEDRILVCMRGDLGMDGCATLVAFGIDWNPDGTFSTTTSSALVNFTADDTAEDIHIKIRDILEGAGWQVVINEEGEVAISHNAHGTEIYSLHLEVEYIDTEGHEENDDHWILKTGD